MSEVGKSVLWAAKRLALLVGVALLLKGWHAAYLYSNDLDKSERTIRELKSKIAALRCNDSPPPKM